MQWSLFLCSCLGWNTQKLILRSACIAETYLLVGLIKELLSKNPAVLSVTSNCHICSHFSSAGQFPQREILSFLVSRSGELERWDVIWGQAVFWKLQVRKGLAIFLPDVPRVKTLFQFSSPEKSCLLPGSTVWERADLRSNCLNTFLIIRLFLALVPEFWGVNFLASHWLPFLWTLRF